MIVWLSVPKCDERYAKQKGAQLSLENGQWFVKDVSDLKPFVKWISSRVTGPTKSEVAKPGEEWIDQRKIVVGNKGRRKCLESMKGDPYAGNLPTFTGKLKDKI